VSYAATHHFTGGNVLVVGDSHTWLGGAGAQYPRYDTDCWPGRTSSTGYAVLGDWLRGRHNKVVFDLATNDYSSPALLRDNLRRVWDRIGSERRLILATSHYPFGLTAAVNTVLKDFAAGKHRVKLVRWNEYVQQNLGVVALPPISDGIHFTGPGYGIRTQMIKDAVAAA
jgi:hypothetical protein